MDEYQTCCNDLAAESWCEESMFCEDEYGECGRYGDGWYYPDDQEIEGEW